jgi:hypothetical protein
MLRYSIIIIVLAGFSFFATAKVGELLLVKGVVKVGDRAGSVGFELSSGDIIKTGKKSFVRLRLEDKTIMHIGPDSELNLKDIAATKTRPKKSLVHLMKGKARIWAHKRKHKDSALEVKSHQISMAVRGTEILTNVYPLGSGMSSDVLLAEGIVEVSGPGVNSFKLTQGQYFNDQGLYRQGLQAVKKLDPKQLEKLRSIKDKFIPNFHDINGQAIDLGNALSKTLSLPGVGLPIMAAGVAASAKAAAKLPAVMAEEEKKQKKKVKAVVRKKKKRKKVKKARGKWHHFEYDLAREPEDIREAVMNYEQNSKENNCFYYFYKSIPGSGSKERFRRTRSCDDIDYDL